MTGMRPAYAGPRAVPGSQQPRLQRPRTNLIPTRRLRSHALRAEDGSRSAPCVRLFSFLFVLFLTLAAPAASSSPLADAAEKSDQTAVRALLKQHADINAPQVDGMTALHW